MSEHSALPWHYYSPATTGSSNPEGAAFLVGPKRVACDRSLGFTQADAELICRAVNSYHEMLAALEAAHGILWMAREYADGGGSHSIEMEDYSAAEVAIFTAIARARAKGETP